MVYHVPPAYPARAEGLVNSTSTLILAELPSSVDAVTILSPQHGRDMPSIVITSTIALIVDRHRSASMIVREQPVSFGFEHFAPSTKMLAAESAAFTSSWGRRLALMPCRLFRFPKSPGPSVQSHSTKRMCPALRYQWQIALEMEPLLATGAMPPRGDLTAAATS